MTAFKIGSVYRQYATYVVRLYPSAVEGMATAIIVGADGKEGLANGLRRLSDGINVEMQGFGKNGGGCDLIPGELTLFKGAWVPVEQSREDAHEQMLDSFSLPETHFYTPPERCCPACRAPEGNVHEEYCVILQACQAAWDASKTPDPNAGMIARDVPKHITENGVVKVRASDVLKTDQAKKQIAAVKALRTALPANPSLTRMAGASHLFGSGWR